MNPSYVGDEQVEECPMISTDSSLDVAHIYGVFVILALGLLLSLVAAIIEFLWNVRRIAIEQKVFEHCIVTGTKTINDLLECLQFQVTPKEVLRSEFMFAVKV